MNFRGTRRGLAVRLGRQLAAYGLSSRAAPHALCAGHVQQHGGESPPVERKSMFLPMSYNEFIKQYPELLEKVDCPECEGLDLIICDCCGAEYDCEKCDNGMINSAQEAYEKQISKDKKLYEKWVHTAK